MTSIGFGGDTAILFSIWEIVYLEFYLTSNGRKQLFKESFPTFDFLLPFTALFSGVGRRFLPSTHPLKVQISVEHPLCPGHRKT